MPDPANRNTAFVVFKPAHDAAPDDGRSWKGGMSLEECGLVGMAKITKN
jgi:hypothetical protein